MNKNNLTPNGVCYDLENSPFMYTRFGYTFHFSSALHLEKFKKEVQKKEDWLCDSLSRRFRVKIDARLIADFQLYCQVETRGYYVTCYETGEVFRCQDGTLLSGLLARQAI